VIYDYLTRIFRKTDSQLVKYINEQTFLRSHELTKHAFAPDVEVASVTQNPQLKNGGISFSKSVELCLDTALNRKRGRDCLAS
jgi:hypothetical protein